MKLDRLYLQGFGKFSEQEFTFSQGLNLVFGENEAGKTTLHNFIRGMLFGFKKAGARRSYDESLERYRPWAGATYAGVMEYTLAGKPFRIERNFDPREERVRILDGSSWVDLTASFPMDKRKEVLFAQEHLGINQVIFDNTVSIRQLQNKSTPDLAVEIQSKLINIASSGDEDVSVRQALEVLDAKLKEIGATERAGKTPLGRITSLVEQLEHARQETLQIYQEIRFAEENKQALEEELATLETSLHALKRNVQMTQLQDVRGKLAKVQAYDQQIEQARNRLDDLGTLRGFPWQKKEELLIIVERFEQASLALEALTKRQAEVTALVKHQQACLQPLTGYSAFTHTDVLALEQGFTRLDALENSLQDLTRKKLDLRERQRSMELSGTDLDGCSQLGEDGENEIYELEKRLLYLQQHTWDLELERLNLGQENTMRSIRNRRILALLSCGLSIGLGILLGILAAPLMGILGVIGILPAGLLLHTISKDKTKLSAIKKRIKEVRLEAAAHERVFQETNQRYEQLLQTAGVANSKELAEKLRRSAVLLHAKQTINSEIINLNNELDTVQQRYRELINQLKSKYLVPAGILITGQNILREHFFQFSQGVTGYIKLASELSALLGQEHQIQTQVEEQTLEIGQMQETLGQILASAGVGTKEEFFLACQGVQEYSDLQRNIEALEIGRSEVLGNFSLEDLQQHTKRLERAIGLLEISEQERPEFIDAEFKTLTDRILENKESIANLQGIIETKLAGVRNVAEIEQDLAEAQTQKAQILRKRQAIEIARRVLNEVSQSVQQEFSPLLNQHLERTISSLTAGRYLAGKISPDLHIHAVVPETGEVKDISQLSLGTVDQFYFALRLALTDLVGVKFPLLLDDAFVQYDDIRLQQVLKILTEVAKERQIIMFSCQRRETEIYRQLAPDNLKLINL